VVNNELAATSSGFGATAVACEWSLILSVTATHPSRRGLERLTP